MFFQKIFFQTKSCTDLKIHNGESVRLCIRESTSALCISESKSIYLFFFFKNHNQWQHLQNPPATLNPDSTLKSFIYIPSSDELNITNN